jgi:hypothetical protein
VTVPDSERGTLMSLVRVMREGYPKGMNPFGVETYSVSDRGDRKVTVVLHFRWWARGLVQSMVMRAVRSKLAPHMAAGVDLVIERGARHDHPAAMYERLRCGAIVQRWIDGPPPVSSEIAYYLEVVRDQIMGRL